MTILTCLSSLIASPVSGSSNDHPNIFVICEELYNLG